MEMSVLPGKKSEIFSIYKEKCKLNERQLWENPLFTIFEDTQNNDTLNLNFSLFNA